MPHPFLTARWANLAIISYAVPPSLLEPYLPRGAGLHIDTLSLPDPRNPAATLPPRAFVSLVAFEFSSTRVFGVKWPGFVNFPEINLRFYVRQGGTPSGKLTDPSPGLRGVVFIREFVPSRAIAWIAKKFYNEPYLAAPISHSLQQDARRITAEYTLSLPRSTQSATPAPREHTIRIVGTRPTAQPPHDSLEHWLKEHAYGFVTGRDGRTRVYEVIHPFWGIYPLVSAQVDFDFAAAYGPDFGFLSGTEPTSAIFAVGSDVAVYPKKDSITLRSAIRRDPKPNPHAPSLTR